MNKTIVIIGNGFDLDQGLKTSYKDFLENIYQPGSVRRNMIIDKAESEDINWCDVEMALAEVIGREARLTENRDRQNDIKRDYEEVSILLMGYIEGIQKSRKIAFDDTKKSFKMIKKVITSTYEGVKIFDFNYTNTVKNILSIFPDLKDVEHHKVHGSIDDGEIIFGVENYADAIIPSKFTYAKKSNGDLFYSKTKISDDLLAAGHIYFFGHSLGESDEVHFSKYFEQIILGDRDVLDRKKNIYVYLDDQNFKTSKDRINERIDALTDGNLAKFRQEVNLIYK